MSLILEALKKSEQQRRLGEAPTLGSPVVATRRRRSLLPLLALLILAVAIVGWWLTRRAPTPAPAAPSPPAPMETMQAPAPAAASKNLPAPAATAKDHAPERPRLTGYATALQKVEQQKRAEALANAKHATTPAQPAAPPKPADASGAAPTTAPPAAATETAKMHALPTTLPSAASTAAPLNAKADSATAPAAQPTTEGAALPTVWDLPFATRKELPAIDLSMHVYSADPKQRFVVIKGDRHVEGDEVGQDLVLREIRPDGLVLEYKGQTFFFPRNGR